jgi:hypothetical protein
MKHGSTFEDGESAALPALPGKGSISSMIGSIPAAQPDLFHIGFTTR